MTRIKQWGALLLTLAVLCGACTGASAQSLTLEQELNVYYTLYSLAMESGDYEEALSNIESCLNMDVQMDDNIWGDLYLKRGYTRIYMGDEAAAMEDLNKALEYIPTSADAMLLRIQLLINAGDAESALAQAAEFAKIYPEQTSVYLTIAELFASTADYANTVAAYTAYLATAQQPDLSAYQLRGQYRILLGRFEEALSDLDVYVQSVEKPEIRANYLRAIAAIQLAQYERALEDLTLCTKEVERAWSKGTAEKMDQDVMASHYYRGVVYMQMGSYEEAIKDFGTCIKNDINKNDARYLRANCAMEAGDYKQAATDFAACIDAGVNVDTSCYYFGVCLMAQEDYKSAVDAFSVCIEGGIMKDQALYNRGMCYIQLGETELGKADLAASVSAAGELNVETDEESVSGQPVETAVEETGETAEE